MKSRFFSVLLILTAIVPTLIPAASVSAATKTPFYYGVWLPFWKDQAGAQEIAINLDRLHEVSPFSYSIRGAGTLSDDLDIDSGKWDGWFSAVHDGGLKIIPTIAWFDGPSIYNLLSNTKKRLAHEDMVAALVRSKGFDGIDIDYESMTTSTKPYYSLLLKGLAIRLHPMKKTLTCTVVPRTPVSSLYESDPLPDVQYAEDYRALNQYCDEVRIMAYDQGTIDIKLDNTKGNGRLYAPTADPAWVEKVIKETLKYVSAKKVMLGIPTYGYEYEVAWNMGATTYSRVRSFTYSQAMDRADQLGVAPFRNNAGELSFSFASTTHVNVGPALTAIVASTVPSELAVSNPAAPNTFFVSFSDASSTADKIKLAKKYGLRGAMLFKADGEMDPATWAMMK